MVKSALEVFEEWVKKEVNYGEIHGITVKVIGSEIKEVELTDGGIVRKFREE
jgi:hypothetical protein